MEDNIPEIDIKFKEIKVEAQVRKCKSKWYGLNVNGTNLLTKHLVIWLWYKLWWKIKPPKIVGYIDPSVLEYYANKEIDPSLYKKSGEK